MTFKILQSVTCGFEPGEVRSADEFPVGTDFKRLAEAGVIRPTGLQAAPAGDPRAELLDQVEDLQDKLDRLGAEKEDADAAHARALAAKHEEVRALTEKVLGSALDAETLAKQRDELRARVAELEAAARPADGEGKPPAAPGKPPPPAGGQGRGQRGR